LSKGAANAANQRGLYPLKVMLDRNNGLIRGSLASIENLITEGGKSHNGLKAHF
jgi:hypothetical protein